MVECVEKFTPEFGCYPSPYICPLYECQIPILSTRPDQNISTGGSKARCPVCESLRQRGRSKAIDVKPFGKCLRTGTFADSIWPRRLTSRVGIIECRGYREWQTAVSDNNRAGLPASD